MFSRAKKPAKPGRGGNLRDLSPGPNSVRRTLYLNAMGEADGRTDALCDPGSKCGCCLDRLSHRQGRGARTVIPGDYRQPWQTTHAVRNGDPAHGYTIEMNEIAITCPGAATLLPIKLARDEEIGRREPRHPILELMPEQVRKAIDTYHGCRSPNPKRRERWGTARTARSAAAVHRILRRRGLRLSRRASPAPRSSYNAHRCAIVGLCRENVRMEQEARSWRAGRRTPRIAALTRSCAARGDLAIRDLATGPVLATGTWEHRYCGHCHVVHHDRMRALAPRPHRAAQPSRARGGAHS